jgi:hypothetical protein
MSNTTWNIIFVAIDNNWKSSENQSNNPIEIGLNRFKDALKETKKSENLNVSLLEYKNIGNLCIASIYKNSSDDGSNTLLMNGSINTFDFLKQDKYIEFLKPCFLDDKESVVNKYIFIFLAHSFGAGFIPVYNPQDETEIIDFFSSDKLNEAIKISSNNKKLDCFLAINCSFQCIENNLIFKDSFEFFIASQRPLMPEQIYYKDFIIDLINDSNIESQLLFSKLMFTSYDNYYLKNTIHGNFPFSLTMSEPILAENCKKLLNSLAKKFKLEKGDSGKSTTPDTINIRNAMRLCDEPSSQNVIGIFDAHQYFLTLKSAYYSNKSIIKNIDEIIDSFNRLNILHLVSPNAYKAASSGKPKVLLFTPRGMGIFIPNQVFSTITIIADIFKKVFIVSQDEPSWATVIENRLNNSLIEVPKDKS